MAIEIQFVNGMVAHEQPFSKLIALDQILVVLD